MSFYRPRILQRFNNLPQMDKPGVVGVVYQVAVTAPDRSFDALMPAVVLDGTAKIEEAPVNATPPVSTLDALTPTTSFTATSP